MKKSELRQLIREEISKVLSEGIFDKFKRKTILKPNSNIWFHATRTSELIDHLKSGGDFINKNEDLSKFNIPNVGSFGTSVNTKSPYFKKGSIFYGYESMPYLITTELPDEAFQPNWNARNYDNLEDSNNVAVLKPNYRDAKYFKLWKRNKNGEYELIK